MLNQELQKNIRAAANILLQGGVVVFPTETVYGLGADAANPQALRRVFEIKGRPLDHPLIVHIGHVSLLDYWAGGIPDGAWRLASRFWPGPLTLILPRRAHVSRLVTGGQDTVGLRVPDHPAALALLRKMGANKGLAAPSANRFGRVSPTTAAHVRAELGDSVDMILEGGSCRVGVESTIVGFTGKVPVLLRPGGIAVSALEEVLGENISPPDTATPSLRTPGSLPSHYAPVTPLEVWPAHALERRAWELAAQGQRVALLELFEEPSPFLDSPRLFHYPMPARATAYARVLYAALHNADGARFDRILAEAPPQTADWQVVHDRLRRAATLYCLTETLENAHEKLV
ncbi:MAG: L-threonylcarbamoyladenylate synthase [Sulfuricella sp.]|nr:L-threonylcarbamoyladenylate synthase [Sulfuricella sp.]